MNELVNIVQQVAQKEGNTLLSTELGLVTAVFPHADEGDSHNYQCTITLKNRTTPQGEPLELKQVPVAVPYMGLTCIPNVQDLVLVQFIGGDINAPVITGRLYNDQDRPPVNNEHEFQLMHNIKEGGTLKIDAEGVITLTSKSEENVLTVNDDKISISNEKLTIEVDFSGEKITVTSTKDIEVSADGTLAVSANEINLKSKAAMTIEAGSTLDIKSSAAMKLKGATIDLN